MSDGPGRDETSFSVVWRFLVGTAQMQTPDKFWTDGVALWMARVPIAMRCNQTQRVTIIDDERMLPIWCSSLIDEHNNHIGGKLG